MAKIVPKLNLNRTPQSADNASLIYAKNIKLHKDGTIGPDYDFSQTNTCWTNYISLDSNHPVVGYIVGLNNKVYYFIKYDKIIASVVPTQHEVITKIVEYDELTDTVTDINSSWTYNGGVITGFVTTNQTGEEILTICEYAGDNVEIPIKHINLDHPNVNDESIYTQNPIIPITNLHLIDTYSKTIPNGVYQFFVRYKISENFYTPWYPCSKECFGGVSKVINTCSGSLKYVNIKTDSSKSFIFQVEHLTENIAGYISFQVGFILSHDNEMVCRCWKEFDMNTSKIYFDYDESSIEDIDIDEMLRTNFEIFNVQNATFFKNKCYISNYKETDFNPDLEKYASTATVNLNQLTVFGTVDREIYFNNTRLNYDSGFGYYQCSTTFYGSNYYDKTSNQTNTTVSNQEILELTFYYDLELNPDIVWVRKSEGIIDFDDLGSDWSTYLRASGEDSGTLYYTNIPHPLQSINEFKGYWFRGSKFKLGGMYAFNEGFNQGNLNAFGSDLETRAYNYINRKYGNKVSNTGCLLTELAIDINETSPLIIDLGYEEEIDNSDITNVDGKAFSSESDMYSWIEGKISKYIKGFTIDSNNNINYWGVIGDGKRSYSSEVIHYTGTILGYRVKFSKIAYDSCNKTYDVSLTQQENFVTIKATRTNYVNNVNITPKQELLYIKDANDNNEAKLKQYTSLMPFTTYDFYIHYVKANGVITNGYKIGTKISNGYPIAADSATIIYPSFSNVTIPEGYVAYFISIDKTGDDVCRLFNFAQYEFNGVTYATYDCLEADTLLYNINSNITVISNSNNVITSDAKYYSSGETNPMFMFGNSGSIAFESSATLEDGAWVKVISKDSHNESTKQLIKITPFINTSSYNDYEKMNLPAHLCAVYKLNKNISTDNNLAYYCAGSDIYHKTSVNGDIALDNISDYVYTVSTPVSYILSNFNLNYLTLTEDVNTTIRSYKVSNGNNTETVNNQVVRIVNTLTSSDIYELPNMYKQYTRKYFNIINDYSIVKFDNTIRSSDTNTDEVYRSIFTFYASDYYNVPCNRGAIVNMFSIADYIYVHCQHSLYRFTGSTSLSSNNGEVQTKETNVFDSGIKEIFDGEFGFGGLQYKTQSLVSYYAYIFYDSYANKIYSYGGEGQLSCISDNIEKIMNYYTITDVKFVDNFHNDRFFVNIITTEGNICLSYSYISKAFISLHDINFIEGFCTRHNSYFLYSGENTEVTVRNNKHRIYKVSKNVVKVPAIGSTNNYIYTGLYKLSLINPDNISNCCCIDIIFNSNYEIIKELDNINWVCNGIKSFDNGNYMAEEMFEKYPGDNIQIYTDECSTDLVRLTRRLTESVEKVNIQNNESYLEKQLVNGQYLDSVNANSYKYPRYNCGIWSLNYFRDIRNHDDEWSYGDYNDKSLIYGKYFVIRFTFGVKNCKIENVNIIIKDYGKV